MLPQSSTAAYTGQSHAGTGLPLPELTIDTLSSGTWIGQRKTNNNNKKKTEEKKRLPIKPTEPTSAFIQQTRDKDDSKRQDLQVRLP